MKDQVVKSMVKEAVEKYSSTIDTILKPDMECGYKRYKSTKENLIKEVFKFKQMLGLSPQEILKVPSFSESVILESARKYESFADKILSNDPIQESIASLEAFLLGENSTTLESYLKEGDDLGLELQKTVVRNLIETLVNIVEACKKKKQKRG